MQSRWGTHGDHPIIALAPNSVLETFQLTVQAFNFSEKYRTPVVLLLDEILGHVNEKVIMPGADEITVVDRERPVVSPPDFLPYQHTDSDVPPMVSFGEKYRYHVTGLAHDQTGFPTNDSTEIDKLLRRLNRKLITHRSDIVRIEAYMLEDAEIGLLSYGSTSRSCRHAVRMARDQGIKAGLLSLKTIWPFAEKEIQELTSGLEAWLVVEMNLGQITQMVEWAVAGKKAVHSLNRIDGQPVNPLEIIDKIKQL
jgi:2-oxoglutarate ferredoxin oxidoreductase subunit alpha